MQIEIQLLDDTDAVTSYSTFTTFDQPAPIFEGFNPLGTGMADMRNHQTSEHENLFSRNFRVTDLPPFPDCPTCRYIDTARTNYRQWIESLGKYLETHEIVKFRVLIKHKSKKSAGSRQ